MQYNRQKMKTWVLRQAAVILVALAVTGCWSTGAVRDGTRIEGDWIEDWMKDGMYDVVPETRSGA